MSYRLDDADWLMKFEVTCRKCRTTVMYRVQDLLRLRYRNLYVHDLQHVLQCPRRCGGTQKVCLPGGADLPEAPFELRLDYMFERGDRAKLDGKHLVFSTRDYARLLEVKACRPVEIKRDRDGEIVRKGLPFQTLNGLPLTIASKEGGMSSLFGTYPPGHVKAGWIAQIIL